MIKVKKKKKVKLFFPYKIINIPFQFFFSSFLNYKNIYYIIIILILYINIV